MRLTHPVVMLVALALCVSVASFAAADGPVRVAESPMNEAVILRLPGDELRIYFVNQPPGDQIKSVGSKDNGKTWGDERTEFAVPGNAYYGVYVTLDRRDELQAVFHIRTEGPKGRNGRQYDVWHTRTTGGRKTWEAPKRIHEGYTGSFRGFTTLKDGRLLLSISVSMPERAKPPETGPDYGWNDVITLWSDDDGGTWRQSRQRLKLPLTEGRGRVRSGAAEPHVRQLLDGRVWLLTRTKNGQLWESFSSDNGETWTELAASRLISSDSPANTLRLRDGRLVLFVNACQRWDNPGSYAIGGRETLHAAISDDDGKTWRGFREVLHDDKGLPPGGRGDRGTAYPSSAQAADGAIVLVSGQAEGRRSILRLDPDWIAATRQSDDLSGGAGQWTMYEGKGAELIPDPADIARKVIAVRKADDATPAGGVWNFPMGPAGLLRLRLMPKENWQGARLALTDHFSVTGDTKADENAVYRVTLGGSGAAEETALAPGRWHDVELRWSADGAAMTIDGGKPIPLKPQRRPAFGVNYLRLHSAAAGADASGFLIGPVSADVSGTAEGTSKPSAATAPAGSGLSLRFEKVSDKAVLDNGTPGAFDERWTTCPSVLRDGGGYRMWYSSFYSSREGTGGIGLATSDDGVNWRRANDGKPLLVPGPKGAFDAEQVFSPEVHPDGGRYLMWYTGQSDRPHPSKIVTYQIGLATSADGVRWERANDGKPVLEVGAPGTPDEVQAATPSVVREPGGWRMWYAAWSPPYNHTICAATSPDGLNWTRENDGQPVRGLVPETAYGHAVCRAGDRYMMLYMALKPTRDLYGATSTDGIHWTMLNGGQPVLRTGGEGAFDAAIVGHPCLLVVNDELWAWYTGYERRPGTVKDWHLRIGLAKAKLASLRPEK